MARRPRSTSDRSFVVDIATLLRASSKPRHLTVEGVIPDLIVSGSRVPEGDSVQFEGVIEAVHEGVLVTGTVTARWTGECRRCLDMGVGDMKIAVRELCMEHGDEETTYALDSEKLDLAPIVHDACILNLPLAPLCKEGCLGFCPECGVNRNVEQCSCGPQKDHRWDALTSLASDEHKDELDASMMRPE